MRRPAAGITIPVEVDRVHDGDTVYVRRHGSNVVYHVRLLDCWAPELNTPAGKKSKQYAEELLKQAKEIYLTVYFGNLNGDYIDAIGKLTSMGRVLGDIWIDEETTLSAAMVGGFHASRAKLKRGDLI